MLIQQITAALHLPNFGARADAETDACTPDGVDCICFFERDWDGYTRECLSSLIGVYVHNDDGSITAYTRDDAYSAFGVPWVRQVEANDAMEAENE